MKLIVKKKPQGFRDPGLATQVYFDTRVEIEVTVQEINELQQSGNKDLVGLGEKLIKTMKDAI